MNKEMDELMMMIATKKMQFGRRNRNKMEEKNNEKKDKTKAEENVFLLTYIPTPDKDKKHFWLVRKSLVVDCRVVVYDTI